MQTKIFSIVTSISLVLNLSAAVLSIIGITITGFYTGIVILVLLALIPIGSKFYKKRIKGELNTFRKNYLKALTILNLLSILVMFWMTFVILHDRFLQDCC